MMSSISGVLGLNAAPTTGNLAPYHTLFHFLFAYVVLSSRFTKIRLKIDHNVNPRGDVTKYGARAVQEGKMSQRQLNFLQRNEGCHANSMEHFPVFASAALFATTAGVETSSINVACAAYTISRIIYAISYLVIEKHQLTYIRSLAWWASNFACIRLFWAAGQAMNVSSAVKPLI